MGLYSHEFPESIANKRRGPTTLWSNYAVVQLARDNLTDI